VRCVSAFVSQPDHLQGSRQGASVEEMAAEVNKARAALETAQKDLKSMASLNRVGAYSQSPVAALC
jgi:multidrug resistance efflux pump